MCALARDGMLISLFRRARVCVCVLASLCATYCLRIAVFFIRVVCTPRSDESKYSPNREKTMTTTAATLQMFSHAHTHYFFSCCDQELRQRAANAAALAKNTTFTNKRAAAAKKLYDLLFQFCRNCNPYKKHLEPMYVCSCFGERNAEENCRIFHFIYLVRLMLDSE